MFKVNRKIIKKYKKYNYYSILKVSKILLNFNSEIKINFMYLNLPKISKLFANSKDSDLRGEILSIVDTKIQNVSIITSNANVIRSNHYHKDFHFLYVYK